MPQDEPHQSPETALPFRDRMLVVALNTACNRRCAECSCGAPRIDRPVHFDRETLARQAEHLRGFKQLFFTGGEPTLHPAFRDIVRNARDLYQCGRLGMVTNGAGIRQHEEVMDRFDCLHVSRYGDNEAELELALTHAADESVQPGPMTHCTLHRRAARPLPCEIVDGRVKVIYDRVYPCCVIPLGSEGIGVPAEKGWEARLREVPAPCEDCFHAKDTVPRDLDPAGIEEQVRHHRARRAAYVREDPRWPTPPDEILIFGMDKDGWMGHAVRIVGFPTPGDRRLRLGIVSHAPPDRHPIRLRSENARGRRVGRHVIRRPGPTEVTIPLRKAVDRDGRADLTIRCDRVFVPAEVDPAQEDVRELGVHITGARFTD